MKKIFPVSLVIALAVGGRVSASDHKLIVPVTIIDRQDNSTQYTYTVPAKLHAQSDGSVACAYSTCTGTETTNAVAAPAHDMTVQVQGATFTLRLPDGRLWSTATASPSSMAWTK